MIKCRESYTYSLQDKTKDYAKGMDNTKPKQSFHYISRGRSNIGQPRKRQGARAMIIITLHGNV
jgi:hypothetical protein